MRSYIIAGILAIILFGFGIYCYGMFIELALPKIPGVNYVVYELRDTIIKSWIFSLTLAFIPIAAVVVYKTGVTTTPGKKILTVIFILGGIALLFAARYIMLLTQNYPPLSGSSEETRFTIPFRSTYLEEAMLAGLFVGAITAWLIFRKKRQSITVK